MFANRYDAMIDALHTATETEPPGLYVVCSVSSQLALVQRMKGEPWFAPWTDAAKPIRYASRAEAETAAERVNTAALARFPLTAPAVVERWAVVLPSQVALARHAFVMRAVALRDQAEAKKAPVRAPSIEAIELRAVS